MKSILKLSIGAILVLTVLHINCDFINPIDSVLEWDILTDIDGNTYKTVKIRNQWWMAENLKVRHYRNGEPITNYWAYGDVVTYGFLYDWYAISDSSNIAPEGWHVPTDEDWVELEMSLGMSQSEVNKTDAGWRGTDEGGKLKETGYSHWADPNTGATNISGFFALPGGCRHGQYGTFDYLGTDAYFWSATESQKSWALARSLYHNKSEILYYSQLKSWGLSVRLVRD